MQSQSIDQVMESIKLDQKYQKNFEDDYKKVFNLNNISLIFDIREDEKKSFSKIRSFINMFQDRMNKQGKRKRTTVTFKAKIRAINRDVDYDIIDRTVKTDEYKILTDKVIRQNYVVGEVEKIYTVLSLLIFHKIWMLKMSINIWCTYILLTTTFHLLSGQYTTGLGATMIPFTKRHTIKTNGIS